MPKGPSLARTAGRRPRPPRNSRPGAAGTAGRCRPRARMEVRIVLAELLLRRGDQAEIMLGMLEIVFRRDRIAGGLGVACQLKIFLRDVIGRSANFHVGAVRFIDPCQRVVTAAIVVVVVIVVVIVAPAHALVVMMLLTVSHGLLFNNSHLRRFAGSLPNPAQHSPALKLQPLAIHAEGPNVVRLPATILVALSEHPSRPRPCRSVAHLLVMRLRGHKPAMRSTGESFRSRCGGSLVSSSGNSLIRPVRTAASRSFAPGLSWQCVTNLGSIP